MLKGIQIIGIGLFINGISYLINLTGFSHELSLFFLGMGCSLVLVGAGKRFLKFAES